MGRFSLSRSLPENMLKSSRRKRISPKPSRLEELYLLTRKWYSRVTSSIQMNAISRLIISLVNIPWGLTIEEAYADYVNFCKSKRVPVFIGRPDVNMFDWKEQVSAKISMYYIIGWAMRIITMNYYGVKYHIPIAHGLCRGMDARIVITTSIFEAIVAGDSYVNYGILEMPAVSRCVLECVANAQGEKISSDVYETKDGVKKSMRFFDKVIETFASCDNSYYDNYCSWYENNFFGMKSAGDSVLYVFPPMIECIINRIPAKLIELRANAVVVVPCWSDNPGVAKLLGMASITQVCTMHAHNAASGDTSKKKIDVFIITIKANTADNEVFTCEV